METVKKHVNMTAMMCTSMAIVGAIVLPQLFHIAGWTGPTFLPMHIPVLLAGLMLGPKVGLAVGFSSPIISSAITGMPVAFPMLPIMILELSTYGVVAGILSKHTKLPVIVSLVITQFIGRLSYALVYYSILLFIAPEISSNIAPIAALMRGMPGIIIQILSIPLIMAVVNKRKSEKE